MDPRLQKQWEVTGKLLAAAAVEVVSRDGFAEYVKYLESNELQLALDELIGLGDSSPVSPDFWWNLKKAAEVMGLESYYGALREKRNLARASANNSLQARRP